MPGPRIELKPSVRLPVFLGLFLLLFLLPFAALSSALGGGVVLTVVVATLAAYVWLWVVLVRRRLILDDEGVTYRGAWSTRAIRWGDARRYTFWSMDQTYAAAAGGAGLLGVLTVAIVRAVRRTPKNRAFTMGCLTIWSERGDRIAISPQFRDIQDALDRAFEELHARLRTRPRDFSPFTLGDLELHHATKGTLALAEVDKVIASNRRVWVKGRGKRRAWARARMDKIQNVMLLLEELAERGMIVDTRRDVFVPPPVQSKLDAATARQQAMPAARIVKRG